jgi:two-component system LytT family sensor kinase
LQLSRQLKFQFETVERKKTMSRVAFKDEFAYHLLLWLLLVGPHSFFSSYLIEDHPGLLLYCILVADGLLIAIVYFMIYVLIGKYFLRKLFFAFGLWLVALFAIYVFACVKMEMDISEVLGRGERTLNFAVYYFINISRYTVIGFLLFRLNQNFRQKKKLDEVTVQKLQAEVNYLRAQINPHFLFNTLNNLYGLALERSEKTPELIIRLSKMMDFMLYEVEGTKVLLQRDIENLENYIEMERIRQGNDAVIRFELNGDVSNQLIEPLLMLPLVENAFKHGVNQMIGGAYLQINLAVTKDEIVFTVKNNYRSGKSHVQIHQSLGIMNLRKRLELFYHGRHSLEIYDDSVNYHVTLRIWQAFIDKPKPVEMESMIEN